MRLQIRRGRFDVKHIAVLSLFLLTSAIAPFCAYSALALSAPVLSEPSDIFFIKGQSTLCRSWHSVSGINKYNYQSYSDKELTKMRMSSNLTNTSLCSLVTGNFEFWWRVRAIDASGNPGEWSEVRKVTVDSTSPIINTLSAIQKPSTTTVTITGSVTEPHLESVSLKLDGTDVDSSAVTLTGNDFTAELQNLSLGEHTVEITATDKAGNKSAVRTHAFTVTDTIAPVITITSPTTFVEDEDVVITGTATDNHSAVSEVSIHVNGAERGTATVTNGEFSHSLGQLAPGAYEITAKGTDAAGNEATSAPVTLTITAKPVVTPPIVVNPETPDPTPAEPTPAPQSQPAPTRTTYLQPAANTAQTTTDTPDDEEATVEVDALALNNSLSARA